MGGEEGKVEDEEDEAVLATVVGEGERGQSMKGECQLWHLEVGIQGDGLICVKSFLNDG